MSTLLLLLAACATTPVQETDAVIEYAVSMPDPDTHLYHVTLRVKGHAGDLDLVMPVWTPGSYKVRDYAQFVRDFEAGGLPFEKIDKTTWRIKAGTTDEFRVSYKVFGHEMSVRHNWLDSEMGTLVGAAAFFYVKGRKDQPYSLRITPKEGWKIATGLEPKGDGWHAASYDVLADSPIVLADYKETEFEVRGVKHRVIVAGPCPIELETMGADFRKIVQESVEIFDHVPYKHYTFLVRSLPGGGGGGLEHLNSTLMDTSTDRLSTADGYKGFLGLAAHEFFHTWLVKRLRPKALGPFDYTKENYTKLLWVMEGFTSYYTPVLLARAGLWDEQRALGSLAGTKTSLANQPGRLKEGPAMASFNAWIHAYQRGPHSYNTTASYYATGKMLGLALDLELRRRGRSLDEVLRGLYEEYAVKKGRGLTPREFQAAFGEGFEKIFRDCVKGGADPELKEGLDHVGVHMTDNGKKVLTLGARMDREKKNKVASVVEGSPAWGRLSVDDEILAINGFKIDMEKWQDRVRHQKDGSTMKVTLFRRGYLKTVDVPVERRHVPKFEFQRLSSPDASQGKAFEAWLR